MKVECRVLLEASRSIRQGKKNKDAGKIPISLHAIDTTTSTGSLTYTLKASTDGGGGDDDDDDEGGGGGSGVEATVRRLTVVELL